MLIIFGIVVVWRRFVFAETEITATAATAAAIASSYDTAYDEARLFAAIGPAKIQANERGEAVLTW